MKYRAATTGSLSARDPLMPTLFPVTSLEYPGQHKGKDRRVTFKGKRESHIPSFTQQIFIQHINGHLGKCTMTEVHLYLQKTLPSTYGL